MDYLQKALKYGGISEQRVLEKIVNLNLYYLWYSFHHISEDLYLGTLSEDQQIIREIINLLPMIKDEQVRHDAEEAAEYYKNLTNDWKEFKTQQDTEFVEWCVGKGKQYEWVKSYYYE